MQKKEEDKELTKTSKQTNTTKVAKVRNDKINEREGGETETEGERGREREGGRERKRERGEEGGRERQRERGGEREREGERTNE